MMPASQAATTHPPHLGRMATSRPAAISTMPTPHMANCASPGTMPSIQGARYCVQSVSRLVNLSMPNTIGATVNADLSSMNAQSVALRVLRAVTGDFVVTMAPLLSLGICERRSDRRRCGSFYRILVCTIDREYSTVKMLLR